MIIFGFGKRKKVKEVETITNDIGEEIHVMDGPLGEVHIKSINPMNYIYTGEQWCKDCKIQMELHGDLFECPMCGSQLEVEMAEMGEGYPTLESTYEDDYGEYYSEQDDYDDGIRY